MSGRSTMATIAIIEAIGAMLQRLGAQLLHHVQQLRDEEEANAGMDPQRVVVLH